MGEKRTNVLQPLSRKHHHVKTYLQPVVRVYKSKIIKKVDQWSVFRFLIIFFPKVPPSQIKETFWLIRNYNEKKIMRASWSEMLDNSICRGTKLTWEENDLFTERIPSGYLLEETRGYFGGFSALLRHLLGFCAQEEIQLVVSYILISLAASLLLPGTYWIVLTIYSQLWLWY